MPELPEVQTVVNHLAGKIVGQVFSDVQILVPKMVSKNFRAQIKNQKIIQIFRRGKMIIIKLAGGNYLLVHLKMTGQLIFIDSRGRASGGGHPINFGGFNARQPNKFTRLILKFKSGDKLLFHDIRKFGWMKIVNEQEYQKIISRYGVEPLTKDFNLPNFKNILSKRSKLKIKQLLLSQELIAGIGNIYADESLFASLIDPRRLAGSLKSGEIKNLRLKIIKILKQAIALGGTSVSTFLHPSGERGKFVEKLKVYKRGNLKCFICGNILSKIKLGGRGTVFCSNCQK